MTPPTRFRFMPGNHSTESPGNRYVLAGASHKPYGLSEPFPFNQPIGNFQRVGGVMTPPYEREGFGVRFLSGNPVLTAAVFGV